jgi:DNA-directed RNA polymerase subunit RPC12/RpoP
MSSKQRGRPRGTPNYDRSIIDEVPARCTKCGSTDRTKDGKPSADRHLSGYRDGQFFNRIIWTRCTCKQCGQRLMVREFVFDPAEKK